MHEIECFLILADKKNFSRTAEALFTTQPTITKYIKHIEKELQIKLFNRNHQTVELTEAGKLLEQHWLVVYKSLIDSFQALENTKNLNKNNLRIGIIDGYTMDTILSGSIETFKKYNPQTEIHIFSYGMKTLKDAIIQSHIDMAFSLDFEFLNMPFIQKYNLQQMKLQAVLSPGHPLAYNKELHIHELEAEIFYIFSPEESVGANQLATSFLKKHLKNPKIELIPNLSSIALALHYKKGITIGNSQMFQNIDASFIDIAELRDTFYYNVIAWNTENHSRALKNFMNILENKLNIK